MRKNFFLLLVASMTISAVCCACGGTNSAESESPGTVAAETMKTDAYMMVLPETITAEEEEDGTVSLLLAGEKVGGITTIDYENSAQLDIDQINQEKVKEKFYQLLDLVAPGGQSDYMFSSCLPEQFAFCLSLVPKAETNMPETTHYFYPKGDVFYDLFFQPEMISETEQEILLDSFTLIE